MDDRIRSLEEGNDNVVVPSHCHTGWKKEERFVARTAFKKLVIASVLCLVFMLIEIVGGVLANSLAIATDAAHLFTDLASFGIGLLSIYVASRPPSKHLSFGWYRAEVLGAMLSVLTIWLVTVVLVYLAVMRVVNGNYEINAVVMMITAGLGILFNVCMMATLGHSHSHASPSGHQALHTTTPPSTDPPSPTTSIPLPAVPNTNANEKTKLVRKSVSKVDDVPSNSSIDGHSHNNRKKTEDINIRAAFIHVIGDLVQSLGVFVASILIYFKPSWKIADPICTFIFSFLVLLTTLKILKDIIRVLMEGTPTNISFNEVRDSLNQLQGVREVHNLRIWSLTTSRIALSAHLVVQDSAMSPNVVADAYMMLQRDFGIEEATVQVEDYVLQMDDCERCKGP